MVIGVSNDKFFYFKGAKYKLRLKFYLSQPIVGDFMNIISLTFQKQNGNKVFYINRECVSKKKSVLGKSAI